MKLVINIDEKSYKAIIEQVNFRDYPDMETGVAIKNGTPLPKGHGRLIDADAVLEEPIGNTYKDIEIAETIIDADKESK